jgi:hypothetical protein
MLRKSNRVKLVKGTEDKISNLLNLIEEANVFNLRLIIRRFNAKRQRTLQIIMSAIYEINSLHKV